MKTLLFLLFGFLPFVSFSQIIDNVNLQEEDIKYIRVQASQKGFNAKKFNFIIDYGQDGSQYNANQVIKDKEGKVANLQRPVDCINFFYKHGWEYVETITYNLGSGNIAEHLTFKKL